MGSNMYFRDLSRIELVLTKIIHSVYTELLALPFVYGFVFEQFKVEDSSAGIRVCLKSVKMITLFLYSTYK